MSGRGETPEESTSIAPEPKVGQMLYDEDGNSVGFVRGLEEGGVFVSQRMGMESLSIEHARAGHAFGSAELVWRCMRCGEMGHLRGGLPDSCPGCAAGIEELMYWTED